MLSPSDKQTDLIAGGQEEYMRGLVAESLAQRGPVDPLGRSSGRWRSFFPVVNEGVPYHEKYIVLQLSIYMCFVHARETQ